MDFGLYHLDARTIFLAFSSGGKVLEASQEDVVTSNFVVKMIVKCQVEIVMTR